MQIISLHVTPGLQEPWLGRGEGAWEAVGSPRAANINERQRLSKTFIGRTAALLSIIWEVSVLRVRCALCLVQRWGEATSIAWASLQVLGVLSMR